MLAELDGSAKNKSGYKRGRDPDSNGQKKICLADLTPVPHEACGLYD